MMGHEGLMGHVGFEVEEIRRAHAGHMHLGFRV